MHPDRRACILRHIGAIAARPWRGETRADQSSELDAFRVALGGRIWREEFPVGLLDARLGFYRRLRDRAGGRHARHYRETVRALEAVKREVDDARR